MTGNRQQTVLAVARVQDGEALEVGPVEAAVTCEQPVSLQESVCPDEELCCEPRPGATVFHPISR